MKRRWLIINLNNELKLACANLNSIGALPSIRDIFQAKVEEWVKLFDFILFYIFHEFLCFRKNIDHIAFEGVKSSCNKARRAALPKSPQTVEEINKLFETEHVRNTFGRTKRAEVEGETTQGAMFFKRAYACNAYADCIFASDDVVNAIQQNTEPTQRKIFADATFKICPIGQQFKQVLILFGELLGHVSAMSTTVTWFWFLFWFYSCQIRSFRSLMYWCHTDLNWLTKQFLLTSIKTSWTWSAKFSCLITKRHFEMLFLPLSQVPISVVVDFTTPKQPNAMLENCLNCSNASEETFVPKKFITTYFACHCFLQNTFILLLIRLNYKQMPWIHMLSNVSYHTSKTNG